MWVDLDVYCLRRIDYQKDYYFGMNFKKGMMSNCVLKIQRNSIALHSVRNFLDSEVPIPFWWRRERLMTFLDEELPSLNSLPWTTTGPNVLTWALRTTGWNKLWSTLLEVLAIWCSFQLRISRSRIRLRVWIRGHSLYSSVWIYQNSSAR